MTLRRRVLPVLTLTIGLMLGAGPAFAQIPGLGVKGGVNLATQRNTGDEGNSDDVKSQVGFVGGAFATFHLVSFLEVQPEVLYSIKGARADFEGIASKLLIDYLEVPLLLRVSKRGGIGYYAAGGPSVAFQMRARTRTKFAGSTEEIDISDQVERLDFGMAIGGGVEIGSLVFDGRYTHGLSDVDKDKSDSIKVTNRALSFTAGFRF